MIDLFSGGETSGRAHERKGNIKSVETTEKRHVTRRNQQSTTSKAKGFGEEAGRQQRSDAPVETRAGRHGVRCRTHKDLAAVVDAAGGGAVVSGRYHCYRRLL